MAYTRKKWIDHITDSQGNIIQQGTPLSATNLNNMEVGIFNANEKGSNSDSSIRDNIPSGFVKITTSLTPNFAVNKMRLNGQSTAYVNGWKIDIADGTIIDMGAPPASGERDDLVFLEVWKDQVTDTAGEKINSRIRVVQGVDFVTHAEGIRKSGEVWGPYQVMAQGGRTAPLTQANGALSDTTSMFCTLLSTGDSSSGYGNFPLGDPGLAVAGNGSQASKDALKTADGYSYAIPLFKVHRRNTAGYSVNNPNGSIPLQYVNFSDREAKTMYLGDTTIWTFSDSTGPVRIGDIIFNSSDPASNQFYYKVVNVVGANQMIMQVLRSSVIPLVMLATPSTNTFKIHPLRADALFADIIDERDIIDLRHQVSLTGFNYQALVEENIDSLLRGDLQTKDRKKAVKVYHGIAKTPTDSNTVFYASMDGTTIAETGGSPTDVAGSGDTFVAAPTGVAANVYTRGRKYPVNLTGATGLTLDFFFTYAVATTGNKKILSFLDAGGTELLSLQMPSAALSMSPVNPSNSGWVTTSPKQHFRLTVNPTTINIYNDGKLVQTVDKVNGAGGAYTSLDVTAIKYIVVGSSTCGLMGMGDIMVSKTDRGANFATLPADYLAGYARIDKAFNGQRKTHSDALASQYTKGLAKIGTGSSQGFTVSRSSGSWTSGDTIKVKGLAGSVISGVIDSDTALAKVVQSTVNSNQIYVDDVSKFTVGDSYSYMYSDGRTSTSGNYVVNAIDSTNKILTVNATATWYQGDFLVEITAATSAPVAKFNNAGTMTAVTGTWTNLGTNEATLTLGTNAALTNQDIQIEYSLNMQPGQGGTVELYTTTLAAEYKGKRLFPNTLAIRDDLVGKTAGDTNPLALYYIKNAAIQNPSSFTTEVSNTDYFNMRDIGNGSAYTLSTSVNGEIPQALLRVDLIKEIEAKYGPIVSADKAFWVKSFVNRVTLTVNTKGSCPSGNKVGVVSWTGSAWYSPATYNFTPNLTAVTFAIGVVNAATDSNGNVYFMAYTDASNGSTPASITIDGINVDIEFKYPPGYDVLAPENPRRDDGVAGILLVRKETKEIQTFFDCYNIDGVVTYGDYVPHQGYTKTSAPPVYNLPVLYVATYGTGSAKYQTSLYKNAAVRLPNAGGYNNYDFTEDDIIVGATANDEARIYRTSTIMASTGISLNCKYYATMADGIVYRALDKLFNPNIRALVFGAMLVNINGELYLKVRVRKNTNFAIPADNGGTDVADYRLNGRPLIR